MIDDVELEMMKTIGDVFDMCEICKRICKEIEETFGHKVDPKDLVKLIETSPVILN